jgi:PAS domain S-box-containing protein
MRRGLAMTTPRQSRDEALEAELEELLVHGDAAVIATDLDGLITHWSAGAQRLYGWTSGEAIGRPFLELMVAPRDWATAEENMESIQRSGGWEGEFELHRKGGDGVLAYVRCAVIKDDAGRPVGMLGLSMDVTGP